MEAVDEPVLPPGQGQGQYHDDDKKLGFGCDSRVSNGPNARLETETESPTLHNDAEADAESQSHFDSPSNDTNGNEAGNPTAEKRRRYRAASGDVPPYWARHHRDASRTSQASSIDRSPAITLVDHTEDPNSDTSRGLWAKSINIPDYVIVNGSGMAGIGAGAYVVWNCKVDMMDVCAAHDFLRIGSC